MEGESFRVRLNKKDAGGFMEAHAESTYTVFIQIISHGIEHRTNITTVLNLGLQTPPQVDGWGYLESHADRFGL
jgi:uncharacterized damage-inducible protein DinB